MLRQRFGLLSCAPFPKPPLGDEQHNSAAPYVFPFLLATAAPSTPSQRVFPPHPLKLVGEFFLVIFSGKSRKQFGGNFQGIFQSILGTLKTLTSLNKEVKPFFLGENSIWSYPSVSSLSDYSIWRSCRLF